MTSTTHDPEDTELASGFSVRDYKRARDAKNREAIAEAIRRRFTERYIEPVSADPVHKHGFTMMAASCLMIEALECFRQGWETSERQSKAAFCFFFDSAEPLKEFRGYAGDFYPHVRCGILHQAETTGGWKIRRDGQLFDPDTFTINATLFLCKLEQFLNGFCDGLKVTTWEGPDWKKTRDKMNSISRHCEAVPKTS